MEPELRLALSAVISLAAAAALVPAAIRASERTGFLDHPWGWKSHLRPTPLLGGAAVVLAFCAGTWVAADIGRVAPLVVGMVGLMLLGIADDWTSLKARHKLPAELGAATLLWATGLGWDVGPEAVNLALTLVWVVAVINAINLFDLLDGQATSLAIVIAAACATLSVIGGDITVACASLALAGACLGFLPFNVASPSRIFLGDAGTIPIGFAGAALTIGAIQSTTSGWTGPGIALVLVAVPLLDMVLRIASRLRRNVSIYTAGHDSAVDLLRTRLRSGPAVSLLAGAGQAALSAAAIASIETLGTGVLMAVSLTLGLAAVGVLLAQPLGPGRSSSLAAAWVEPGGLGASGLELPADLGPGVLVDEPSPSRAQGAPSSRLTEKRHHRTRELQGIVGLEEVRPRDERQAFCAGGRGDDGLPHGQALQDLEPGTAPDPERDHEHLGLPHVRPDVRHGPGDLDVRPGRGGPQAG